jgi:RecQ family ATP-dependent DNA helicase
MTTNMQDGVFSGDAGLYACLKKYFGYGAFRLHQLEAIKAILYGRDVSVCMATGSGKSVIYQLPPLFLRDQGIKATTVVVSPLIALMTDQVDSLNAVGINAAFIGGTQSYDIEMRAARGEFAVLYSTPEKILRWTGGLKSLASVCRIVCVAVDEAHCVSEWGHDFRPEYRLLYQIREQLSSISNESRGRQPVPIVALTATATASVRNDIATNLGLHPEHARIVSSFNRQNLFYMAELRQHRVESDDVTTVFLKLQDRCKSFTHDESSGPETTASFASTLIYVRTRSEAEGVALALKSCRHLGGLTVEHYHAGIYRCFERLDMLVTSLFVGMAMNDRNRVHRAFLHDEVAVVVSTVAFGMGIHKPDIRIVINCGLPVGTFGQ